jgi:ketosteroid isomerase-like protein
MGDKLDLRTEPINRLSVSKHNMKTATLIAFVAVFTCQLSLGQTPAQQEVLQFERDACKAFLDADVAALERVLTPEFTLTLSNGEVSTRADEINELRSGKVHYDVFENYDMLARLYGNDTAVVLGKTRVKGTADGKPFDRVVQFTDTLIKRDGRWQLAAGHVSRIEK